MATPQARATRCWRRRPARAVEILASKSGECGLRCPIVRELILREFGHSLTAKWPTAALVRPTLPRAATVQMMRFIAGCPDFQITVISRH